MRVNHALEHATITILSQRVQSGVLRGRSNRKGFYIMGDVADDAIRPAADEALARLRSGESDLAIHPFCGTNVAVSGLLAGVSAAAAGRAARRGGVYPAAVLAALFALLAAQPLGFWTQRHLTTNSEVRGLHIIGIEKKSILGKPLHFVRTTQ
jgi:hypothetical protein